MLRYGVVNFIAHYCRQPIHIVHFFNSQAPSLKYVIGFAHTGAI